MRREGRDGFAKEIIYCEVPAYSHGCYSLLPNPGLLTVTLSTFTHSE